MYSYKWRRNWRRKKEIKRAIITVIAAVIFGFLAALLAEILISPYHTTTFHDDEREYQRQVDDGRTE